MVRSDRDQHGRLFRTLVNYGRKSFVTFSPGVNFIKSSSLMLGHKKLDIFSFVKHSSFLNSDDVKPMSNDLVQASPDSGCLPSLYVYTLSL